MNVMIVVTNIKRANGGVTTHVIDLCKELIIRGNNVVLVADDRDSDYQQSIEKLKDLNIEKANGTFSFYAVEIMGVQSKPLRLIKTATFIGKVAKENKINIIHSHGQTLCIIAHVVKLMTGIPFVWTNHIDEMAQPDVFRKVLKLLHFPIISVSTDLKEMLVNEFGIKPTRITVVNNGINPENFIPLAEGDRSFLINKYHCEGKYIIGLLARMSHGKGHIYLLRAVDYIQKHYNIKNIKVLIAGQLYEKDKKYLEELEKYSMDHSIDMEFLGFQNPKDIFGISDVAVLPSLYEGFPLTVLESLIMGCPVIRTNTPGWKDTQDYTLVFEKKDVEGFAQNLYYAYNNPEIMRRMGEDGRNAVLNRFTIGIQVKNTITVYEKYAKR